MISKRIDMKNIIIVIMIIIANLLMEFGYSTTHELLSLTLKGVSGCLFILAGFMCGIDEYKDE